MAALVDVLTTVDVVTPCAVFRLPLAAEARVSDESIDAEYSRRMIATQAARFVWQSEQEFARTAFEWLASPSMQARLRDRGR